MTTEQSGGIGDTKTGRSTRKGPSAFRTIGEASEELGVPQHVLRFWETKFSQLKPLKRAGGRRYYRPEDMELLTRIRDLLYQDGFTIKGAKRSLSQKGGARGDTKGSPSESGPETEPEGDAADADDPAAPDGETGGEPEDKEKPELGGAPEIGAPEIGAPELGGDPEPQVASTEPQPRAEAELAPPAEEPPPPAPAPAPLFDSLSTPQGGQQEAQRLRSALEDVHRDLTRLRKEIAQRLS